jgi:hypothetical protein
MSLLGQWCNLFQRISLQGPSKPSLFFTLRAWQLLCGADSLRVTSPLHVAARQNALPHWPSQTRQRRAQERRWGPERHDGASPLALRFRIRKDNRLRMEPIPARRKLFQSNAGLLVGHRALRTGESSRVTPIGSRMRMAAEVRRADRPTDHVLLSTAPARAVWVATKVSCSPAGSREGEVSERHPIHHAYSILGANPRFSKFTG